MELTQKLSAWLGCIILTVVGALTPPGAAAFDVKEVAPGVFVHFGVHEDVAPTNMGDISNSGFVIGKEAVAVIDTGGSFKVGSRLRAAIRRKTDLPIRYVILTHVHPDHIFGAAAFDQDAPVVLGHVNLQAALTARGDYYLQRLKEEFLGAEAADGTIVPEITRAIPRDKVLEIDLGGRILTLRAHATAHTDNDLTVLDQTSGAFWLADLLFRERVPRIDGSVTGWIEVLDDLAELPVRIAIPGHGQFDTDWPHVLDKQRAYLNAVADGVRRVIRKGGTLQQATKTVGWDMQAQWQLFDDYHPGNVTAAYVELEWE